MDLISRKAAIDALGERPENWTDTPAEIEAVRSYDNAIDILKSVPSVPAVPLDKLCKWLQENALLSYKTPLSVAGWKYELTQWMEEQDAKEEV